MSFISHPDITADARAALRARYVVRNTITGRTMMDELNGRMIACQILITGLIARVASNSPDPPRFLTDFRDEIRAVVKGVNIAGMDHTDRVRLVAQQTVDEVFTEEAAQQRLIDAGVTSAGKARFMGISLIQFRTPQIYF
jgi:hypothetical protein